MEGKVAVIGDADFVMPFSAMGVDTYAVEQETADIQESARKILSERYFNRNLVLKSDLKY